jgi:general secretion pathway protein D
MKTAPLISLGAALLLTTSVANAQLAQTGRAESAGGVPLPTLIATVAKNTGMRFVLDPRVQAEVTLVGEDPSLVTYDELLTILNTYGFVAVKTGGYVVVKPDADTRMEPLPFASGNEKLPDDEAVTAVIHVKSLPAGWLVPILRPLVPQWGHFAAMPCSNDLVIVERFASVRRMETIIKAMDTGAPIKPPSCIVPMPLPWQSARPLPPAAAAPHPRAP